MKIRKFVALVICLAGLILSLLSVSFAVDSIVSPMSEPTVDKSSDGGNDVYRFYAEFFSNDYTPPPDRVNSKYSVFVYTVVATSGSTVTVRPGSISNIICSGGRLVSATIDIYDAISGNYYSNKIFSIDTDGSGTKWAPYFPNLQGSWFFKTDGVTVRGATVSSFIEFSAYPPEHNIYHSELSEPVADEYNSYFICNDKLYWLSYRANGLYSYNQNVEVSSVVSSESASYGSSGSGSYSGQSGGQTDSVTAPYVIVSGSVSNGEVFNGSASSPNFGQIDYVGSSQGNLSFSQNGNITYNSVEVYPVSISNQLLNRLFDVVIYLTDSSGFKVWLVPRSDLGQSLILDASLYCSAFDLTNGEYLSSSFSSYSGSYQYAGFDYPLEEPVSDVRCYGCAFYNLNNIPVNLSDVLWQYDLSFVLWREDVLQKLNDIYNVLSEAESITSYQAPDLASKMDDENIINDLSYNSGDVQHDLNDNIDRGIQALGSDGGQLQSLTSQIIGLGNGKIFSLLIISLSLGILILILGKNKND